jgi:cysteinyl-tRNA synthetase
MLEIYNSLTRTQSVFAPIDPNNVRMYVCGMTVYDYCHIGHARVLVVFDVLYRYLCEIYGREHVTYIRNITDIDDKIIARANENRETTQDLTGRFIAAMHEDAEAIGVLSPNEEPRATVYMDEIITMIRILVEKGYAYAAANGDVYYDVSQFTAYGRLSGRQLEDLRAGARVEIDEAKDDPLDFVLWNGILLGDPVARAGTSSVPPCRPTAWGIISIFTAAAWTCSFPITRMKSRKAAPPLAISSPMSGCTTVLCA